MHTIKRREILKLGAMLVDLSSPWKLSAAPNGKRVIVAGAGLAGLCCAYELTRHGHDVVVLEASNRTGGHVRTLREGLADGLYVDGGAEHFTKPGYELLHSYVHEFNLPVMPYRHMDNLLQVVDGQMITEQEARSVSVLKQQGFNQREVQFLGKTPWQELADLYFAKYAKKITDEYNPFGVGLDQLDGLTVTQLLQQEGASPAAIARIGSGSSALHTVWRAAILRIRGVPTSPRDLYRIRGGNQMLPDAFARRLDGKIQKNSPVVKITRHDSAVSVTCRVGGGEKVIGGDYLVCCMNTIILRQIPVTPAWPELKQFAISNMPYTIETRQILQSRTKFWKKDGLSGNMEFGSPIVDSFWPMAQEVPTERGLLIGTGQAGATSEAALKLFRRYYPGKSADIEHAMVFDWSRDKWAMGCQSREYKPGELHKFWPTTIQPVGRVYFAGAYCDNMNWGMEAATRSAHRVARAIHEA